MSDRYGFMMITFTGKEFWPLDPRPEEVDIIDIAHALSMEPRYGGHTDFHYSVAQHSVLLYNAVSGIEHKRIALLHDATEAYIKDIIRGFKPYLIGYSVTEEKLHACICERFGITSDIPLEVKDLDNRITIDETAQLRPRAKPELMACGGPIGIKIHPCGPGYAEYRFLETFKEAFPEHASW